MVFVDPYMLTLALVCVVLMIAGNIYFLAHYSHHADSFFGSSAMTKAVLVSIYANNLVHRLHFGRVASADDRTGRSKHKE